MLFASYQAIYSNRHGETRLSRSRVHPQIARPKLGAFVQRRGDREQEVVELNSKLALQVNDPTQENLEIKARPCFPEN
jgi:hypothetical protein